MQVEILGLTLYIGSFVLGFTVGSLLSLIIFSWVFRKREPKNFVNLVKETEKSYKQLEEASKGMRKVHGALLEVDNAIQ